MADGKAGAPLRGHDGLRELLEAVAAGAVDVEAAAGRLAGFRDLGFARLDVDRARRTGDPEVIYGAGKTPAQVAALVGALRAAGQPALATRLTPAAVEVVLAAHPDALLDAEGRCLHVGDLPAPRGCVTVVAAGTSDGPVAAEAAFVARAAGADVRRVSDVGVAGLHRLVAARADLVEADCLVVVAGMEGALPSVVGGLVGTPLVAVPTSIGYGVSAGGFAALLTMLSSCAPGVVVCNIDNGFGAGIFAARVARRAAPR